MSQKPPSEMFIPGQYTLPLGMLQSALFVFEPQEWVIKYSHSAMLLVILAWFLYSFYFDFKIQIMLLCYSLNSKTFSKYLLIKWLLTNLVVIKQQMSCLKTSCCHLQCAHAYRFHTNALCCMPYFCCIFNFLLIPLTVFIQEYCNWWVLWVLKKLHFYFSIDMALYNKHYRVKNGPWTPEVSGRSSPEVQE